MRKMKYIRKKMRHGQAAQICISIILSQAYGEKEEFREKNDVILSVKYSSEEKCSEFMGYFSL